MAKNPGRAHVTITADGKQAVETMRVLAKAAKSTGDQIEQMQQSGEALTNPEKFKQLNSEYKTMNQVIKNNKYAYIDLDKVVADLGGTTLRKLEQSLKLCKREMQNLTAGDPKMKTLIAQYKAIDNQIGEITGQWKRQDGAIKSVLKRLAAYVGIYGVFNVLKNQLMGAVQSNIAFSDSLADIRKTTGLSADEVNRLSNEINKIDTRTSREDLHKLAYEAGRLGLGKYGTEGILGFTRAADQLSVALKEDLGEDAIVQLTKLSDVMGDTKKLGVEKSLLSIGSAINELAQSSTATGTYMTGYASRLSGIAVQAHLTTAELLGFAAASDSTGQELEVAATAMNKFIVQIQTHYKTVAAAAGINADALHSMLEQGKTADAIMLILGGLKEKGGLSMLAPLMKDLGSDGARLTGVLATLSTNVDMVETSLRTAREAFGEATSVTQEYSIKNENAAAIMERMRNSWDKLFTNSSNTGVVKEMVQDLADLSTKLQTNKLLIFEVEMVFKLLMVTVKTLIALLPYLTIFFSVKGIVMMATAIKSNLIPSFMALITNIKLFAASSIGAAAGSRTLAGAIGLLSKVLKSNVFIALASVLLTLIFRFGSLKGKLDDAQQSAENLNNSFREYTKISASASIESNQLFSRLKNTTKGTDEHRKALRLINEQYGKYLPALLTEKSSLEDIATAQELVNKKLRQSLALKAKNAAIDEVGTQYTKKMADNLSNMQETYNRGGISKVGNLDIDYITEATSKYMDAGRSYQDIKNQVWDDMYRKGGKSFDLVKSGGALSPEWKTLQNNLNQYIANAWNQRAAILNIGKKYDPLIGDYVEPEDIGGGYKIVENLSDSESKKQQRLALKIARDEHQAVMSAIDVFYKQQQQVANQAYVDKKITMEEREKELEAIENKHLQTRIQARLKLHGDANTWQQELNSLSVFDMAKTQQSAAAIANLRSKDLDRIGNDLRRFGEREDDGIWNKLEEDKLKMQKLAIDHRNEVEKILLEYDYTGRVTRSFQQQLEKLRIFFTDYSEANKNGYESAQQAAEAGMNKLYAINSDLYSIDINSNAGLEQFKSMITNAEEFGVQMLNMANDDYRALYYKALEYGDAITEAQRKARERQLKIAAERYKQSGREQYWKDTDSANKSTVDIYGSAQQLGLASDKMIKDQEVMMYEARLNAAVEYYTYLKANGFDTEAQLVKVQQASNELSAKMVEQIKTQLDTLKGYTDSITTFGNEFGSAAFGSVEDRQNAVQNMLQKMGEATNELIMNWVRQKIEHALLRNSMMNKEEEYADSQTNIAKGGGKATEKVENQLGRAAQKRARSFIADKLKILQSGAAQQEGIESASQEAQNTIAVDGQGAVMQALTKIGDQTVNAKKAQAVENVTTSATETSAEVPLGIASGAAKTIGQLGWWGIPLVAVISALLGGLLNMAMGKVSSAFGSNSSTNTASSQAKLVTGMLTYDGGNVQRFSNIPVLGNDGRMYNAQQGGTLGTGMVNSPTVTTIGGTPALVGERGPEMVIGRETTAAMMMSRPDLLAAIISFDRNRSGATYKAYDNGNVQQFAGAQDNEELIILLAEIREVLTENAETNAALTDRLSRGISANISKYGKGNLVDEVIDGIYTTKRNGSNDKLNKLFKK